MEAILNMVRSVTVFLLLAGIVSNMPGEKAIGNIFLM